MGTILASYIISTTQVIIQDTTGVRWPSGELLGWVNEGQREIVLIKPEACVVTESVLLVEGTKQSIPPTGIVLLDIIRNMGSGSTPGNAIRGIARQVLDEQIPDWHTSTASNTVVYAVSDIRNPKVYYVYPPQTSSPAYIEIACSSNPVDCATTSSAIGIDDIYSGSLIDYCLYRAYSKDAEYAGNGERAMAHYNKFTSTLAIKGAAEKQTERQVQAR